MTDLPSLLPPRNATEFVRALEQTMAAEAFMVSALDTALGIKNRQLPSFVNFLLYDYGLIELTPYMSNVYTLLEEGREWQYERDTMAAIHRGLGWLGVTVTVDEAPVRRQWWNSFQLYLDDLPPADEPDLARIGGLTRLSKPYRSDFRRGVHDYDAPAMELDECRLDAALVEHESGARIRVDGPLWSFGRLHERTHTVDETEGTAIGNWVDETEDPLAWVDLDIPWEDADFSWDGDGAAQRAVVMANWFDGALVYLVLKDSEGAVIGYRRARACVQADTSAGGPYLFGVDRYAPAAVGQVVYVEALTGFGDGAGQTAASASLLVNPTLETGVKPGKLWLEATDLAGGNEIATHAIDLVLRETVREQFKFILRF